MATTDEIFWGRKPKRKPIGKINRDFIRHRQGYKCKKCGSSLKRGGNIHHKNGKPHDNRFQNLELLCTKCHKDKTKGQAKRRAKESRTSL